MPLVENRWFGGFRVSIVGWVAVVVGFGGAVFVGRGFFVGRVSPTGYRVLGDGAVVSGDQ